MKNLVRRQSRGKTEERAPQDLTFSEFVSLVNRKYRWFRHCQQFAAIGERIATGELKRVMVFVPPRHGKSETFSRLFTAWFLWKHPHWWVGLASYGQDLANTLSRAAQSNYLAAGGTLVSTNVMNWTTPEGGGMWCAGVGGPITGKGAHLLVIDDPLKDAEEAGSLVTREKVKEWYTSTFATREEPWSDTDQNAAIVIVQTRWHEDDLAGWLLEEEKSCQDDERDPERWHVVSMEALKESGTPEIPSTCTLEPDWRKPGEALCPERRSAEWLDRLKRKLRAGYWWWSLYQQRPRPPEGSKIKREWIRYCAEAPDLVRWYRGWDTALTKGGDETGTVLIGVLGREVFIAHASEMNEDSPEVRNAVKRHCSTDPHNTVCAVETSTASLNLWQDLKRDKSLERFALKDIKVHGKDKLSRAMGWINRLEAGEVFLVKGSWNARLVERWTKFTNSAGDQDALIDAMSVAFEAAFRSDGAEVDKTPRYPMGSIGSQLPPVAEESAWRG